MSLYGYGIEEDLPRSSGSIYNCICMYSNSGSSTDLFKSQKICKKWKKKKEEEEEVVDFSEKRWRGRGEDEWWHLSRGFVCHAEATEALLTTIWCMCATCTETCRWRVLFLFARLVTTSLPKIKIKRQCPLAFNETEDHFHGLGNAQQDHQSIPYISTQFVGFHSSSCNFIFFYYFDYPK